MAVSVTAPNVVFHQVLVQGYIDAPSAASGLVAMVSTDFGPVFQQAVVRAHIHARRGDNASGLVSGSASCEDCIFHGSVSTTEYVAAGVSAEDARATADFPVLTNVLISAFVVADRERSREASGVGPIFGHRHEPWPAATATFYDQPCFLAGRGTTIEAPLSPPSITPLNSAIVVGAGVDWRPSSIWLNAANRLPWLEFENTIPALPLWM